MTISRFDVSWCVARVAPRRPAPVRIARLGFIPLLGLALAAFGCGREPTTTPIGTRMPDFALTDVNPSSASALQPVSPRAYLARVSAWYFGHAT